MILHLQDSISDFSRSSEHSTGSNGDPPRRKRILKTTNAYFYWVTREQGSFDWFKGVMNEVAELDQRVKKKLKTFLDTIKIFPRRIKLRKSKFFLWIRV